LGQGDGTFVLKSSNPTGKGLDNLVCANLDNDKIVDLALPVRENNQPRINVLYGRGDGTFEVYRSHSVGEGNGYGMTAADLDADGAVDLATGCYVSGNKLCLLYGIPLASACDPPGWATTSFQDSFESGAEGQEIYGTNGWTSSSNHDQVLYDSSMALCGSQVAIMQNYVNEQNVIHPTGAGQYFTAQVWLYDNLSSLGTGHLLINTTGHEGAHLGFHENAGDYYWYWMNGHQEIVTSKSRELGWHKLAIRRTPDGTYHYIDGQFVGRSENSNYHDELRLVGRDDLSGPEVVWDGVVVYE
jgi:hypothetical protein